MTQFKFKYIDTFLFRKLSRCLIKDSLNETRFCLQNFDFLKSVWTNREKDVYQWDVPF